MNQKERIEGSELCKQMEKEPEKYEQRRSPQETKGAIMSGSRRNNLKCAI